MMDTVTPFVKIDLNTVINAIIGGGLWLGWRGIAKRFETLETKADESNRRLGVINGSIARTSQWIADHDKRVEDQNHQHDITRQQCQQLHQERLNSVNERINELWGRIGDRRQGRRSTD